VGDGAVCTRCPVGGVCVGGSTAPVNKCVIIVIIIIIIIFFFVIVVVIII